MIISLKGGWQPPFLCIRPLYLVLIITDNIWQWVAWLNLQQSGGYRYFY